jgi:hypothetical protein
VKVLPSRIPRCFVRGNETTAQVIAEVQIRGKISETCLAFKNLPSVNTQDGAFQVKEHVATVASLTAEPHLLLQRHGIIFGKSKFTGELFNSSTCRTIDPRLEVNGYGAISHRIMIRGLASVGELSFSCISLEMRRRQPT